VDEELWKSSNGVIYWQLDAHCGTLSCSCAQKIDRGFQVWKILFLIQQRRKYMLNKIFLVVFLPFREGIQGHWLPRCGKHHNHNFIDWNFRSEPWNHFLKLACKPRVGFNKVTDSWLVTSCNSIELQLGILIQQRK
jgi:hypothetical protein